MVIAFADMAKTKGQESLGTLFIFFFFSLFAYGKLKKPMDIYTELQNMQRPWERAEKRKKCREEKEAGDAHMENISK